ncbi:MAG TPA: TlpA disulfide reductase family protein [Polyangiaceae bacterium]|nr:TlpA disulfide reductase family protein [Polyangiaceae bacterium]
MTPLERTQPSPPEAGGMGTLGAVALLGVLLAGFAFLPRLFPEQTGPLLGHDAPDFRLDVVANGKPGPLGVGDLHGSVVVLDFWATWCGPCRAETPILDALSRRWRDRGVTVVGIDTDTPDQGDPRAFAQSEGLSYPIVHDETGAVSRRYGVEGLPTLVVISPAGKVVAIRTGLTDDEELERLIRKAL